MCRRALPGFPGCYKGLREGSAVFEPPLKREMLPPDGRERTLDLALRPKTLAAFVGQKGPVRNLKVAIDAARIRNEPLDHVLLSGLPGLGKTTLAELIARELQVNFRSTSAPVIERAADLAGLLAGLKARDVLFIDEVHRLPAAVEEYLYSAMEDFFLDIVIDQGPRARSVRLQIEPFTLVGATTREGLLAPPFRARFGVVERLEPYDTSDLVLIAKRTSGLLKIGIDPDAAEMVASRARGTPRLVNRFLRRLRDLAQVEKKPKIDLDLARRGLEALGLDERGLCALDRKLLEALARSGGAPLGLKTLAISVGEDERTIEDVYEPFLIREGYMNKTSRGRVLLPKGEEAAGEPPRPREVEGTLFREA
jgi:Holliday junction DNA helicase RuvB